MSIKLKQIIKILNANEYKTGTISLVVEPKDIKRSGKEDIVKETYYELGGIREEVPTLNISRTLLEPKIILLLDEGLHFNRYRNLTLRSEYYSTFQEFPLENYRRYCRTYEKECIKAGLKTGCWSNTESDYYFGPSSAPGDFFKNGSGGWKLVACKDFLEDIFWPAAGFKVIRIAAYDHIMAEGKLVRIDSILESHNHPLQPLLIKFLDRKINTLSNL